GDSGPQVIGTGPAPALAPITLTLAGSFENVVGTPFGDTLTGGAASSRIEGGGGNDVLGGGTRPTTLRARAGSDTLVGGTGGTTYQFGAAAAGASDTVVEPSAAVSDTLDFSQFAAPVSLDLGSSATQAVGSGLTLRLVNTLGSPSAPAQV